MICSFGNVAQPIQIVAASFPACAAELDSYLLYCTYGSKEDNGNSLGNMVFQ